MKERLFKKILPLLALLFLLNSCGSATGAPPVSIPAPAPAKIRVTSPNDDGLVTVTGSAGAVSANTTVRVTNVTASGTASLDRFLEFVVRTAWAQAATTVETTAAADGSFSVQIAASVGDSLRIVVIDPTTGEESDPLDVTTPSNTPPLTFSPSAITVDGSGNGYAVGVLEGQGIAAVINLATNTVTSTFNIEVTDPQAAAYDPGDNELLIADPTNDTVLFVDLTDPLVQTTVAVDGAQSVAVDTATNCGVIGTTNITQSVVLIDLATETVTNFAAITNAGNPAAVYQGSPAIDASGGRAVIVSTFDDGSSQITAKDLTIPAFTNFEVVAASSLQGVALISANQAIAVDSQGNRVLMADLTGATTSTGVTVGNDPRKVTIDAAANQALVTNSGDHTVSIVDLNTRAVTDTLDVGINPVGVAFSNSSNVTLVGNTRDDSVTILE